MRSPIAALAPQVCLNNQIYQQLKIIPHQKHRCQKDDSYFPSPVYIQYISLHQNLKPHMYIACCQRVIQFLLIFSLWSQEGSHRRKGVPSCANLRDSRVGSARWGQRKQLLQRLGGSVWVSHSPGFHFHCPIENTLRKCQCLLITNAMNIFHSYFIGSFSHIWIVNAHFFETLLCLWFYGKAVFMFHDILLPGLLLSA